MAYDRYDDRGGNRGRRPDEDHNWRGGPNGGGGMRPHDRDERGFFERARDEFSSWFGDDDSHHRRMEDDRSRGRDNMNWSRGGDRNPDHERYSRGREEHHSPSDRNQGMFGSRNEPWGRGREEERYGREQSRGGMSGRESGRSPGGMFSHDDDHDRDYRQQSRQQREYGRSGYEQGSFGESGFGRSGGRERDRGYPGTLGQSIHRDRDQSQDGGRGFSGRDDGYRPMTGDYGRGGGGGRETYRSGMGSQDFARSQYGRQDFSQDQDRDREYGERTYNYGGWGDRDSQRQSSRGSGVDDHYSQWRQRQIQDLDRDYDDYRREHQSKFENEFSGWRQQRQTKRQMLQAIREHMEVVDQSGEHIGTIDKVRGDTIILTRNDPSAGGVHRSFSCSLLDRVEDKVYLSGTAASIRSQLHEEREDRDSDNRGGGGIFSGLFGGGRSDEDRRDERSTTTNRPEGEGPHVLDRSFSGTYDDEKK
ncbi:DUF2171 domain-containing protein [Sphingomonas arenae]|uniref:DUF2171 domain-containing protein n=1 Tax=Sphingomonas arenae TaxID=2812555 RepID=UPI001967639A|nr:DUF2171 domain-containing protein [Sphingomonas arenae]